MTKPNIGVSATRRTRTIPAQNNQCNSKFRNALARFNPSSTPIVMTETTSTSWLVCLEQEITSRFGEGVDNRFWRQGGCFKRTAKRALPRYYDLIMMLGRFEFLLLRKDGVTAWIRLASEKALQEPCDGLWTRLVLWLIYYLPTYS